MADAAVLFACASEEDRKSFRAQLTQTHGIKDGDIICAKKAAHQRYLWEWEHVLSGPIHSNSSAVFAVAVRVRSKVELHTVARLAGATEVKTGITPGPWPSVVLEAVPKYASDKLP